MDTQQRTQETGSGLTEGVNLSGNLTKWACFIDIFNFQLKRSQLNRNERRKNGVYKKTKKWEVAMSN